VEPTAHTEARNKSPAPASAPTDQAAGPFPVIACNDWGFQADYGDKEQSTFTVANQEDEDFFDGDSAFGGNSTMTDTTSLNSSILRFREENGRRYHSFGRYCLYGYCSHADKGRIHRALGTL